ncbi:MAG TPA: hypothetical protein VMW70_01500 [Burkholderiales bacterium]|nr:hypothetical protein [Burkholderiales bacterium]
MLWAKNFLLPMVLAVSVTISIVSVANEATAAEDSIDCPEGDGWLECRAEAGDRYAIYRQGRTAYEEARESGDFSEALRLSRQLAATDDRNGARLLKMVHMQLGWGGHKDYVQAYAWLNEDAAAGIDYLDPWIRTLAEKMTAEQIQQAEHLTGN